MWKAIAICGALFTMVIVGIRLASHILQASYLSAFAAAGMSLVGLMLIALAPSDQAVARRDLQASEDLADEPAHGPLPAHSQFSSVEHMLGRTVAGEANDAITSLPI